MAHTEAEGIRRLFADILAAEGPPELTEGEVAAIEALGRGYVERLSGIPDK